MKKILFLLSLSTLCSGRVEQHNQKKMRDLKEAISRADLCYVQDYLNEKKRRSHIEDLEQKYGVHSQDSNYSDEESSLIELARLCLFDREKAVQMAQRMDPYSQLAMGTTCIAVAIAHVSSQFYCASAQKGQNKTSILGNKSDLSSAAQKAMSPLTLATVGVRLVFLGANGLKKRGERDNAEEILKLFKGN